MADKYASNHLTAINGCVDVESADGAVTFGNVTGVRERSVAMAIQAINGADVTVSAYTDSSALKPDGTASDRLTTIAAGTIAYGNFSALTVSAGTARCYIR